MNTIIGIVLFGEGVVRPIPRKQTLLKFPMMPCQSPLQHNEYPYRYHSTFFLNDTATPEIYTLSLHDALPICVKFKFVRIVVFEFQHRFQSRRGPQPPDRWGSDRGGRQREQSEGDSRVLQQNPLQGLALHLLAAGRSGRPAEGAGKPWPPDAKSERWRLWTTTWDRWDGPRIQRNGPPELNPSVASLVGGQPALLTL